MFVAIHGGYWRALSRHHTAFMAGMLADAGIATVAVDYGLAPHTPLEEIVRQVRAAVAWVYHHGAEHGLDRNRIVVGGSSAGGHLTATTMVSGWQAEFGLPDDVVRAAMPISDCSTSDRWSIRSPTSGWVWTTRARARSVRCCRPTGWARVRSWPSPSTTAWGSSSRAGSSTKRGRGGPRANCWSSRTAITTTSSSISQSRTRRSAALCSACSPDSSRHSPTREIHFTAIRLRFATTKSLTVYVGFGRR
ncbi:alpha/beta hydrolase fold domain-containing protein [Rhodococcus hoagii]|nr:alpha/beta hydrolase fold domain-containing protein [Prescottella equi]